MKIMSNMNINKTNFKKYNKLGILNFLNDVRTFSEHPAIQISCNQTLIFCHHSKFSLFSSRLQLTQDRCVVYILLQMYINNLESD